MKLDKIMDEVASVLSTLTGLNVFAYPPATLTPPAGYVSYPRSIDFDETYGRGCDQFTDLPIVVVAGKADAKSTRDRVAAWADGDGPKSLKRAMEAHEWTSCESLDVGSVEFDTETVAGVPYLAAMFKATVMGPGKED